MAGILGELLQAQSDQVTRVSLRYWGCTKCPHCDEVYCGPAELKKGLMEEHDKLHGDWTTIILPKVRANRIDVCVDWLEENISGVAIRCWDAEQAAKPWIEGHHKPGSVGWVHADWKCSMSSMIDTS